MATFGLSKIALGVRLRHCVCLTSPSSEKATTISLPASQGQSQSSSNATTDCPQATKFSLHGSLLIPGSSPARVPSRSHFLPQACSSSSQPVAWSPFPLSQAPSLQRNRMVLTSPTHDPCPRRTLGLRPTIILARARGVPLWRWCLRHLLRAIDCGRAVGGHG